MNKPTISDMFLLVGCDLNTAGPCKVSTAMDTLITLQRSSKILDLLRIIDKVQCTSFQTSDSVLDNSIEIIDEVQKLDKLSIELFKKIYYTGPLQIEYFCSVHELKHIQTTSENVINDHKMKLVQPLLDNGFVCKVVYQGQSECRYMCTNEKGRLVYNIIKYLEIYNVDHNDQKQLSISEALSTIDDQLFDDQIFNVHYRLTHVLVDKVDSIQRSYDIMKLIDITKGKDFSFDALDKTLIYLSSFCQDEFDNEKLLIIDRLFKQGPLQKSEFIPASCNDEAFDFLIAENIINKIVYNKQSGWYALTEKGLICYKIIMFLRNDGMVY